MKKVLLIGTAFFVFNATKAQLNNTKWKGVIQTNTQIDVVFNFHKDSLSVDAAQDGSNVETMTYAVKDSIVTIKKIFGQSDCDTSNTANYAFRVAGEILTMRLVNDNCSDRSDVLNNLKLTKMK